MIGLKHILVPTDFSEPSERALAAALELARAFDARITLLHVWSVPRTDYAEGLSWPLDDMERAARRALDGALESMRKRYAKTDALLREGGEAKQILAVASEEECDLIVMGTHGRRGLPRLLLGSVAEKVVRLSPVPVLSVSATPTTEVTP
jgi:nucleotide-binding universal stress UspA family protein